MEAHLPELIDVPCPHCKGVPTTGVTESGNSVSVSYCLVCRNSGFTVEALPRECPWCAAPREVDAYTRYGCGAAYSAGWNQPRPLPESSCGRISEELAGQIAGIAKAAGLSLRDALGTSDEIARILAVVRTVQPARLPELRVSPCPTCGGVPSGLREGEGGVSASYCIPCQGTGHVQERFPALCPWCHAEPYREPAGMYGCHGSYRVSWNVGGAHADQPCTATPADIATVARDIAAQRGEPLLTVLEGAEGSALLAEIRATARDRRPYEPE